MSLLENWDAYNSIPSQQEYSTQPPLLTSFGNDDQTYHPQAATLEATKPIFSIDPVEFHTQSQFKFMTVANNVVVIALYNSHIVRVNLDDGVDPQHIEISRKEDAIQSLFLDPTGNHLIIGLDNEENMYLHSSSKKPKTLGKLKGLNIEAIGWDRTNVDKNQTKEILIGAGGSIYETSIQEKEKYLKQIYHFSEPDTITGIQFEYFPPVKISDAKKFFIMVTTRTRIYQFIGGPNFETVFREYENIPTGSFFSEMPSDGKHRSQLAFWAKQFQGRATSFAWLTGPGIYSGELVFGSQQAGDQVISECKLIPYPPPNSSHPINILITEFHFLLLYSDKLQAISRLNEEVVYEEHFIKNNQNGQVMGMTQDFMKNTLRLFTKNCVFEIVVNSEDRNVWELYLKNHDYDTALKYCKNPHQQNVVWTAQAEHYFKNGNYELAANFYAQTSKPFEEVALLFISIDERDALKTFLQKKLQSLEKHEATQKAMICTWLTEIFLNKLDQIDPRYTEQIEVVVDNFQGFLKENHTILNRPTTFTLISSHGRIKELLFYAELVDYERVISHYIQQREWKMALQVLARQNSEDLYYKFSTVLIIHQPKLLIQVWFQKGTLLNPKNLIPSLNHYHVKYNPPNDNNNYAILYLENCVEKMNNRDPVIHNYLVSLYAQDNSSHRQLLTFLAKYEVCDLKYALRVCMRHNKKQACVMIYTKMSLYEEAVDLALKEDGNRDLGSIADKPTDPALRKKLWLRIARHVVEEKGDINRAMDFLKQCDLLKIEYILPFFPPFTVIDKFKDEICSSLEEYNQKIEKLKEKMDESTRNANQINNETKSLKNRYGFVNHNQKCELCGVEIIDRAFFLFPCQHAFHIDCTTKEVISYLDPQQKARVKQLEKELSESPRHGPEVTKEVATMMISKRNDLKSQMDQLIGSECLF